MKIILKKNTMSKQIQVIIITKIKRKKINNNKLKFLGLTAFKNSRRYYEMKKSLAVKEQKTLQASDKGIVNKIKTKIFTKIIQFLLSS